MVVSSPAAETIFERFEIEFDAGPEPIFHGGELITGSLKIQLKNESTINAIRLQFRGRALFLGPTGNKKAPEGATEKVYFDKDFVLLERPPGHPEPGHFPWNANFLYSLPFECPLPKGCETSYESPYGFIRYYARVILETDEPNKAQYLVKKAFSIVSSPELHQLVPPQSEPIVEKKTVRFGGCCCRGKMTAEIHLPKSAYAPGENIVGTFTVDSRTAKNALEHIEVRLVDRLQRMMESPEASAIIVENGKDVATAAAENNKETETTAMGKGKEQKKKAKKETVQKKQLAKERGSPASQCQRVVIGRKLAKEDLVTQLEQTKGAQLVTQTNVFFIRVPAVTPSTQIENERKPHQSMLLFDELVDGENADNGHFHRLLESPSTATLRTRKEPFLRVDYALQISMGTHVLLELPIQVHPIPIYAKGIEFRPFAAGAQPIGEPDESNQTPFGAPFTFTPQYPMYLESPKPLLEGEEAAAAAQLDQIQVQQIVTLTPVDSQKMAIPNGMNEEKTAEQNMEKLSQTVIITTADGKSTTKVQRKEEIITKMEVPPGDGPQSALVVENKLEKSPAEMGQQPMVIIEGNKDEQSRGNQQNDASTAAASPIEHKHFEENQQLANGHSLHTTIDEWRHTNGETENANAAGNAQDGEEDNKEIRRIVEEEHYEVHNEDGSKTIVQKTTEKISTVETHIEEQEIHGNGQQQPAGKEQSQTAAEGNQQNGQSIEENDNNNTNDNNQQQLQMDVSMSG